jgi:hypothetical protein
MDKFEKQWKIFTIQGILLLVSAVSMIAVTPAIFKDTSPGALPKQAGIAASVGAGIHLLLALGFVIGARLARLKRRINTEINMVSGIALVVFGFIIMDGAFAFMEELPFVSVGIFLAVFCDFAAAVVSVAALFILRRKKKN